MILVGHLGLYLLAIWPERPCNFEKMYAELTPGLFAWAPPVAPDDLDAGIEPTPVQIEKFEIRNNNKTNE